MAIKEAVFIMFFIALLEATDAKQPDESGGMHVLAMQCFRVVYREINLVPRSQSSVRECRNVRSGKVRYNAISGWLPELRMPHSYLLCDWLFPSVFGSEKFSLRLRLSCDVLIHTCPLCGERTVRNCFFGRQQRL